MLKNNVIMFIKVFVLILNMLIDIHSHLDHFYFDKDRNKVISNAKKAGLKVILSAGTNHQTNKTTLEIAKKYDIVKACMGFYPIQPIINNSNDENKKIKIKKVDVDEGIKFIEKNKKDVAAIAEVGLDYKEGKNSEQKELFQKMIDLAEKLKKPILVHSRKAESDCVEMLQSSKLKKIIMHCFSGKRALVKKIVDNGWFLTAPTCITRSSQFQENVKFIPITQLFCETDAPYLSPFSARGEFQRNEPSFVVEAYKKVAEIKGMEFEEVVKNVFMNYQKVF
jgi:TatD DNase family protein